MTDWLKFYIGGLIADISAHKAMIEEQQAEIDRLNVEIKGLKGRLKDFVNVFDPPKDDSNGPD